MDTQTLVTIAAIVFANIGTTIGLFMWATTHAATASENLRQQNNATSQSIREEGKKYSSETQAILKGIADEMKDFHARLCVIEERNSTRLMK